MVEKVGALRAAVRETKTEGTFRIDARVLLAGYLHAATAMPEGTAE
jgi:hypothetical protein